MYEIALLTGVQVNVTECDTPVAPSAGETSRAGVLGHAGGGSGALTVVVTLAVLLVITGSADVEETDAVLVMLPAEAGAVALMVSTAVEPLASDASEHVSVPEAKPHAYGPPVVRSETPAGSVSVTVTFCAAPGPLFITVTV